MVILTLGVHHHLSNNPHQDLVFLTSCHALRSSSTTSHHHDLTGTSFWYQLTHTMSVHSSVNSLYIFNSNGFEPPLLKTCICRFPPLPLSLYLFVLPSDGFFGPVATLLSISLFVYCYSKFLLCVIICVLHCTRKVEW